MKHINARTEFHAFIVLYAWRVQIGVEHDDGECEHEHRVRVAKLVNQATIAFAVARGERLRSLFSFIFIKKLI